MTKLFVTLLGMTSAVAFAEASLIDVSTLPRLSSVTPVIVQPPFAHVQQKLFVEFSYSSCARMDFQANVQETDSTIFVSFALGNKFDCMAVGTLKSYQIEIDAELRTKDGYSKAIVVLNPLQPAFKTVLTTPSL